MVQADITKMEQALEQLKEAGADLFSDEIVALHGRIVAAQDELAAEADKAAQEVSKEATEAKDGDCYRLCVLYLHGSHVLLRAAVGFPSHDMAA